MTKLELKSGLILGQKFVKTMPISRKLLIRLAFTGYFFLPLLFFATQFKPNINIEWTDLYWALESSVTQATWAAIACIVLGIPMALSLVSLKQKNYSWVSKLLLVPQIFPALFTILITFSVLNPFPMGHLGIIILFVVVNLGLSAVLLAEAIKSKCIKYAVVSEVFSINKWKFKLQVLLPLLKSDLFNLFFLVFAFCISSFSIPLVAGGGKGINLEIAIYEKIFIENNWQQAFTLGLFQTTFIFFLGMLLTQKSNGYFESRTESTYLRSHLGLLLVLLYLLFYIGGYAKGLFNSLMYLEFLSQYVNEILKAMLFSFLTLLAYSIFQLGLLYLWLKDYLNHKSFNPMLNLVALSTVVVGFAFYLTLPANKNWDIIKLVLAISILSFTTLFKLFLEKPISDLQKQIVAAQVFGLSHSDIIVEVIFKQIKPNLNLWFFVSSIWFVSDYAISKATGVQTATLGLITESFLTSYRLPVAFLLTFLIFVFVLLFVFIINQFLKVIYVISKKY
jgi:thiamine transport system permease protein